MRSWKGWNWGDKIFWGSGLQLQMEQYLQSKVGTGFYSNASEVVRDAIRRMREEDEKLAALRAAVQIGDDQLDRGEGIPYTPERLETITAKALANSRNGKKVNPDPGLLIGS